MAALSFRSSTCFLQILVLVGVTFQVFPIPAISHTTVTHLPGFEGPLPFHLETGYVSVGEPEEEVELFYYFIKSGRNPKDDPFILWLVGGPGCSGLTSIVDEIGPLRFKMKVYDGNLPTVVSNPYAWTQKANFLFVDLPVATGFTYMKSPLKSKRSDYQQLHLGMQFLRKWLTHRPGYLSNPFYVGGHSYVGMIAPAVALEIDKGNEKGIKPSINLKGYLLGNPKTNNVTEANSEIPFAHRLGLISDELYESLKRNCKGAYQPYQIDPNNTQCLNDIAYFNLCTSDLDITDVLAPVCGIVGARRQRLEDSLSHRSLEELTEHNILKYTKSELESCLNYMFVLTEIWANDKDVQRNLGVRPGTVSKFYRCNREPYIYQMTDMVETHAKLSAKGYRSLIYSGDHDMWVSYISTEEWITSLNYSIVDEWRPWFVEDQVGGYTRTYSNRMTFATVKGGKHEAPMNRPKETWFMFRRWIDGQPI